MARPTMLAAAVLGSSEPGAAVPTAEKSSGRDSKYLYTRIKTDIQINVKVALGGQAGVEVGPGGEAISKDH